MASLDQQIAAELEQIRISGLYRTFRTVGSAQGPRIAIAGREYLNFSSNDYLGLADDPILKRAATAAIDTYGVGSGASRLVCGNLQPYDELESRLAAFKGKEAAIVFGSGYAANVGTITALVGKGDLVILDKLDHASIIDGARQSGATIRVYPHKNLKKLEDFLKQSVVGAPTQASGRTPRILIVTETVFSMDGDLAPLVELVALKERYNAWLMIDEAHATGLYGHHRRGLAEPLGVEGKIDITLGTLSKALGCAGGFVVGSQVLIDYLRNRARSLIYSTALPPSVCAAAAAAVDFVMSDQGHERRDQLWRNVSELKQGLSALGVQNESRSPIIPIIIGDEAATVEMSAKLFEQGIFVPAIRFPTVPKGKARLRVTVTAGHGGEDIRKFLKVLAQKNARGGAVVVGAVFNRDRGSTTAIEPSRMQSAPISMQRPAHSSDLRKGRSSIPNECYFITTCVEGRNQVFADPDAAQIVVESLRWLRDAGRIRLLGFVVMPDHVHLALALCSPWTLPQIMHSWKRHASRLIRSRIVGADCIRDASQAPVAVRNRSHRTEADQLWQSGYHDHLLRDRADFDKRLEYMHDNPRRKGLSAHAEDYPFSTAHPDYRDEIDWAWLEGVRREEDRG
jgi:8-amino-7-oxononanoate synthase